jgi:hypothetical protein
LTSRVIGLTFGRYLRNLWHPVAASLVMAAMVLSARALIPGYGPLVDLLVSIPVGCVAYVGYHLLTDSDSMREALNALELHRLSPFLNRRRKEAPSRANSHDAENIPL